MSPSPTVTGSDDDDHTVDRAWTAHADRFVAVYTAAATTEPEQWRARIAALSTKALADGLASTDPAVVPTGAVAESEVIRDDYSGGGQIRYTLDTDVAIIVTVVLDATGAPKAAAVEPVS